MTSDCQVDFVTSGTSMVARCASQTTDPRRRPLLIATFEADRALGRRGAIPKPLNSGKSPVLRRQREVETGAVAARGADAAIMVGRGRGTASDSRTAAAEAIGGGRRSEFREANPTDL